jgi:hypothetical protein
VAAPISDAVVVDVLRRVDRLMTPLADGLGPSPTLPPPDRDRWWAERASVVAAGASALPRFAGKLADVLPLQNTVGAAVQSLVILGIAGDHGVRAPAERVALLARVLVGRDLTPEQVTPLLQRPTGTYREEALGPHGRRGVVRVLWRTARLLSRIDETLDARPKGRLHHRALANLPVVGVFGGYAAERVALSKAAVQAADVLRSRQLTV